MSRFLFVVAPFAGSVDPTVAIAAELKRRGHFSAWTGVPGTIEAAVPEGRFFAATGEADADRLRRSAERAAGLNWCSALRTVWEETLLPLGRAMLDGIDAVASWMLPDAVIVDQQAFAGAAIARKHRVPWATSAASSAGLVNGLAGIPTCDAAVRAALVDLQLEAGVPPAIAEEGDLRCSSDLVLACTARDLAGPDGSFPSDYQFVGPCTDGRCDSVAFPWEWLDDTTPTVVVTLGSSYARAGARFFPLAAEALGGLDLQAVFVAPPDLVPMPPANILVRPRVPHQALLRRTQLVVCHAGHDTVSDSLRAGVPLVVVPIRADEPIVADQVVRAGAGRRMKHARLTSTELRDTVLAALDDPDLHAAAQRLQRSFAIAGGPTVAADHLEKLAASG